MKSNLKHVLLWLFVFVMFGLVAYMAFTYRWFNQLVWGEVDVLLILAAIPMMAYITCWAKLLGRFTWTHLWIGQPLQRFRFFKWLRAPSDNIVEEPLKRPIVWGPYAAMLLFALPAFACVEEWYFRHTVVRDASTAVFWSIMFGLSHLVMLVRLKTALALCVAGFLFSLTYLEYGLAAVVMLHTAFNIVGVSVGVIEMRYKLFKEARELRLQQA